MRSCERIRPQAGVGKLKHAPPLQANDLPLVAQAVSPANDIFSRFLREGLPSTAQHHTVRNLASMAPNWSTVWPKTPTRLLLSGTLHDGHGKLLVRGAK